MVARLLEINRIRRILVTRRLVVAQLQTDTATQTNLRVSLTPSRSRIRSVVTVHWQTRHRVARLIRLPPTADDIVNPTDAMQFSHTIKSASPKSVHLHDRYITLLFHVKTAVVLLLARTPVQ